MYNIIAICGAKRSGKDVLAKCLINKYNYEKLYFYIFVMTLNINSVNVIYTRQHLK